MKLPRRAGMSVVAFVGFMLSPLSWWNDAVVNIPLAYLFALPFTLISHRLLLPMLILGYWLTNIIGLLLLHGGIRGLTSKPEARRTWPMDVAISLVYTAVLAALVLAGVLKAPWQYF